MKTPTLITRFLGTPWIATLLYIGCALTVLGWAGGGTSWWVALAAVCFAANVYKAVHDVRKYKQWWADWEAMGSAPGMAASTPIARGHNSSPSSRAKITLAVTSLLIVPLFIAAAGANEGLRSGLVLLWLGVAAYLLWKLTVAVLRAMFGKSAGKLRAGASNRSASTDIVKWVLPPASSSPSRADTMRGLPDYCARLMVSH